MVTNINFLLTISIDCQEIWLWELINWSPKRKCFDLSSNSLNSFFEYRDQFRKFVRGYWGLKGQWCYEETRHEWLELARVSGLTQPIKTTFTLFNTMFYTFPDKFNPFLCVWISDETFLGFDSGYSLAKQRGTKTLMSSILVCSYS